MLLDDVEAGDELLISGSSAIDDGGYPVMGSNGRPLLKARDFMNEVKLYIRFPIMDAGFIATTVHKTRLFTVMDEYRIVQSVLLKDASLAKPFSRQKRRPAGDFESSIHFVRGRASGSWVYNGPTDCIELTPSRDCMMIGVGLWLAEQGSDVFIRIIRGRNEGDFESRVVFTSDTRPFNVTAQNQEPVPFTFAEPFELENGRLYTIELNQVNRGGCSSRHTTGGGAMRSVSNEGLTLRFSNAHRSPNGTDTSSGAFPVFYMTGCSTLPLFVLTKRVSFDDLLEV